MPDANPPAGAAPGRANVGLEAWNAKMGAMGRAALDRLGQGGFVKALAATASTSRSCDSR